MGVYSPRDRGTGIAHQSDKSGAGSTADTSTMSPVSEEDRLRASVYSLLARLLAAPPDEEILDLLEHIEVDSPQDAGVDVATARPGTGFTAAWHMLRLAASNSQPAALDDEYHALFIGIGRGELVPFGSWYLTGFLMDKPLSYLRQDLARFGIERSPEVKEPEDHVAALCETMAIIAQQDPEEISLAQQQSFFANHVEPWMGLFFEDLENAKQAVFYKAVGRLGRELMAFESRYLAMPS